MKTTHFSLPLKSVVCALAAVTALSACAPLVLGGAMVGGSLMAIDRRTSGTQVEDQAIELKSVPQINRLVGDRGHVNTTSYNRIVLITGEVPTEADKAAIEQAVAQIANVKSVVNELAVMGSTSLTGRTNDVIVSSKVKATFFDAKDVMANAIKLVTERGTVYLMGRVTEREANRATDLARGVSGVQKVVRVFEVISEAELADMTPQPAPK